MHDAARNWLSGIIAIRGLADAPSVLDLGGRDVNGTIHSLFSAKVTVLDIADGTGVDIVADAATWVPKQEYDVVLCTEVFEHDEAWGAIIDTAHKALRDGGILLVTCARDERPPHSAIDGGGLREGEWYQNISGIELLAELEDFADRHIEEADGYYGNDDLYCWAAK